MMHFRRNLHEFAKYTAVAFLRRAGGCRQLPPAAQRSKVSALCVQAVLSARTNFSFGWRNGRNGPDPFSTQFGAATPFPKTDRRFKRTLDRRSEARYCEYYTGGYQIFGNGRNAAEPLFGRCACMAPNGLPQPICYLPPPRAGRNAQRTSTVREGAIWQRREDRKRMSSRLP